MVIVFWITVLLIGVAIVSLVRAARELRWHGDRVASLAFDAFMAGAALVGAFLGMLLLLLIGEQRG